MSGVWCSYSSFLVSYRYLTYVIAPPSVTLIEGTVTSLQEEDGCVTGVQYKEKETGDIKVRLSFLPFSPTSWRESVCFMLFMTNCVP